ncbi:MFS transporter AraJ [Escherichia coli]|uniref:MFS transporter AraJ n=1 Tax=Escherichia coli TaxID=562 RepID=A0A376X7H6_ECOLX|nr:MFS transporter AraJ [Escherichia coli]
MALLVVILQAITLLATVIGSRSGGCDGGMKKVILSLALGTFGLGMAEFGIMGVLTELAHNVGISIPAAGHMISYYALGVVVGAPIIALFSSRYSLKHILFVSGGVVRHWQRHVHALFVLPDARHWSGWYPAFRMAHFFGVGAIVLSKIIKPGKVTAPWRGWFPG